MDDDVRRTFDEIKATRRDDEERIRKLENVMVTREDITTAVDRAEARTKEGIEAVGLSVDKHMETLTLTMKEVPEMAKRIMELESATPAAGMNPKAVGGMLAALTAAATACGAAIKGLLGGD